MIKKKYLVGFSILGVTLLMFLGILIGVQVIFKADEIPIESMEMKIPDNADEKNVSFNVTNDSKNFKINGKTMGPTIRVKDNTHLKVKVKNNSDYPISIHFHGVDGLNKYDGVSEMTQDAIEPGQNYTYEFYLDEPGTYMYHSHIDSNQQVNNEFLYGGLVVESNDGFNSTNSQSLILNADTNSDEMHDQASSGDNRYINQKHKLDYDIDKNQDLKLNIVNMASMPMIINFKGDVNYQVTNVDAHEVNSKVYNGDSLYIPAANRVEIVIKNPTDSFAVYTDYPGKNNATAYFNVNANEIEMNNDSSKPSSTENNNSDKYLYLYDIIDMKKPLPYKDGTDIRDAKVDKEYDMSLNMSNGSWTINDEAYPNTKTMNVDYGDIVQINLQSTGHMGANHPFHLHGHEFQVISINGEPIDKNLVLDTVEVKPGDEVSIRFEANNPGIWPFHCHDLTHADMGMMTTLKYNGYYSEDVND